MDPRVSRIRRGDIVKVVWKDACEGPVEQNLAQQVGVRLRGSITVAVSSIGRFLKVSNGYLVLDDVIYEESDGQVLYEKQADGKWLSIPLGVVAQVIPVGEIVDAISKQTRTRRTIFRQLKFIPRAKRLTTGEVSRMLYMTLRSTTQPKKEGSRSEANKSPTRTGEAS